MFEFCDRLAFIALRFVSFQPPGCDLGVLLLELSFGEGPKIVTGFGSSLTCRLFFEVTGPDLTFWKDGLRAAVSLEGGLISDTFACNEAFECVSRGYVLGFSLCTDAI